MTDARRRIPSVDSLIGSPELEALVRRAGRTRVVDALRDLQSELRTESSGVFPQAAAWYAGAVAERLAIADRPSMRRVINATGVVLHTNLGRAPLAESARQAVVEAVGYTTLEFDVDSGTRGSRHDHCVRVLRDLTGAEDALVVNNNAAAVVLALNTLASDGEAVISRGELVEIGGSFRIPEIMARSGARMREVGATNRTHLRDYGGALGPDTRLVLKVHRSNFRVDGFTAEVGIGALAELTRDAGIPLVYDLGSGALVDLTALGLPAEPTIAATLAEGADVVTLSGDKLLGGPQAGIVVGRAEMIRRMRENPLCRAVRCDKLTLAALEATLLLYRNPDRAFRDVPVLRMLSAPASAMEERARRMAAKLADLGLEGVGEPGASTVGGGACPGAELPTTVVSIEPGPAGAWAVARALRLGSPSVVARIRGDRVLIDPRTIDPAEDDTVVEAVRAGLDAADALRAPSAPGDSAG